MQVSERLGTLPPYLAADIAARVARSRAAGGEVIDLSVGSPDLPPDPRIVEAARSALLEGGNHGYVIGRGLPRYREAAARYLDRRFGISLDPDTQILALLGSKEGLGHLPIALCDPGDITVHPDPGYPVYRPSILLAGARPLPLPLDAERGWLPDWEGVDARLTGTVLSRLRVRLVILNYPHNPTAATAGPSAFDAALRWARAKGAVLVNDNAYADIGFDGYRPPSVLQAPEAEAGGRGSGVVEFHSMSKTFSMAGWRCGFAAGDPEVIAALARVKSFYDTGLFAAVQIGAAAALDLSEEIAHEVGERYRVRRDLLIGSLTSAGLRAHTPRATIYLWARLPESAAQDDATWCSRLLEEAGIALSPGSGYGERGRGWVRLALTERDEVLEEAAARIKRFGGGR